MIKFPTLGNMAFLKKEFFFFFFVAGGPFCAPWACLYIISGAGVVSGTLHPAVWDTHIFFIDHIEDYTTEDSMLIKKNNQ